MEQENHLSVTDLGDLFNRVEALEKRLGRIEGVWEGSPPRPVPVHPEWLNEKEDEGQEVVMDKNQIESNIFEYGLAWFGSLVLLFGIIFLTNFARSYMNSLLASAVGFLTVGGVFLAARTLRHSFGHLAYMLTISGFLLIFYITLRLHFFTPVPAVPVKFVVVALLLLGTVIQLLYSVRRGAELPALLAMFQFTATALITDSPVFSILLLTATGIISIVLMARFGWWRLMLSTLVIIYAAQVEWLLSNPLMGHPVGALGTHPFNLAALFLYGTTFSVVSLIERGDRFPEAIFPVTILLNGLCFSAGILFVAASYYSTGYVWIFTAIFLACLVYSIFLRFRTSRIFDPAFFAIYSFMALSVAVYGYYNLPSAFWLLSLQSLLVVSWALWFRSKIIVVMNTLLFLGIVVFCMAFFPPNNQVNFAFVFTAFISARVINWKKERLTLKTELIRNTYLITLFITMLFALYHAVPGQYVTLSWTCAAVIYFILSLVLKNIKYRWMAIATVLFTGFYLFFVDLSHLETGYRVLAFLFLAVISIGASLYFTKKVRRKSQPDQAGQDAPQ